MNLDKNSTLKSIKFGDLVEVGFDKKMFHGEFIRTDEEKALLVVKLKSGYDVAIPKKEISRFKILERAKSSPDTKDKKHKMTIENPDITMITTGGTISSKVDYKIGGVYPSVPPEYYLQIAPGLKNYGKIEINDLMSIWSENMKPSDWIKIANAAYNAIKKGSKGIIVTTGTDTMHFTSAALSFMLNPLSVPVIITGAQRSTDRGSSDASTNLLLSAIAASKWDGGESAVCMHATLNDDYNFLIRGNRVRKMHSERRDAFRPINYPPLAKVHLDGRVEKISDYRKKAEETIIDTKIDDNVRLLLSYPGMKGDAIKDALTEGAHGIVIEGTGFGNLPLAEKSVHSALVYANKENIPVVITSQTIYGATNKFVYTTLREISGLKNVIYARDILSEVALVKLMFVLGKTRETNKVREMMTSSLVGEISDKDDLNQFLI
jgi:glutamyl-tRNA(Gln) amidotransferase subunit D